MTLPAPEVSAGIPELREDEWEIDPDEIVKEKDAHGKDKCIGTGTYGNVSACLACGSATTAWPQLPHEAHSGEASKPASGKCFQHLAGEVLGREGFWPGKPAFGGACAWL